jgi:DNA processing protein
VVVEAGKRSGSISTANHALAIGRTVGAVPGPITSTASFGTNRLIADGFATLVTNASEVCLLAGDSNELQLETQWQDLGDLEKRALDAIGKKPMEAEDIAIAAGLSTSEASIALSNLLLLGQVKQANGRWCRVSTKES